MAYHREGDRIKADFLDVNGKVIRTYDYVCFGTFFSSFEKVRVQTTLVRIYLRYKVTQRWMDYYLNQLKVMGFFENIKVEAVDGNITLSMNPDLVTAQEMFWVSTCIRVCCFNSGICRTFGMIHRKTGYDAGKLILLSHFFRVGGVRNKTEHGYSDHTLIGGYNPCYIKIGIDEMLKRIRSGKFVKLRRAADYRYAASYQGTIREFSYAILQRGEQVFTDVSQFKGFLCQD